jgi:site-specific DNA-methyltransferase (adenine-specific)
VTLLSYLVYLLSRPGDVILDPFAGSGSTGEAGLLAGRSVILIEMDNEFYSSLTDRLKKLSKGH